MELEIGQFVRTEKGIAKIINIFPNGSEPYYEAKYETDTYLQIYYDSQYVSEYDIIKVSFDIINLIEYNDYVNGERIVDVIPVEICGDEILDNQHIFTADGEIYENEIKSIVTKEQFEQISYKVVD